MNEEPLIKNELPEQLLEQQEEPEPENFEEASEELGEDFPDGLTEEAKASWEDSDEESPQGGVAVGMSPLGPVVQVIAPNGDMAQKVVSVEELFLLSGQMTAIASLIMQMGMQHQMQEQARLQQMMEQNEEQTKSGLYVKRH
jgi:hypothetical protein